ncbi:EfeM/EfeO family lipoprotein [Planotetraspora kaengkrachanensis]|uniref:Iron transporter n=1 Tax=Planotetraspora kaengkrachanensis TaxID=575193 RepID=A0A8J3VA64_9ACTN|nr:EfeM/EfeO family lipoprotein [Planotetraspora kaengkrachanensis]GIG83157.1 iron transporter [Planotetraspora kaengkrachanensis]
MHVRRASAVIASSLFLVAGCSDSGVKAAAPSTPAAGSPIQISTSHCGQGWTHPAAGRQTLTMTNTGTVAADAYVIDVPGGAVYGEIEGLAPGVTRSLPIMLGQGTYAIRCQPEDGDPLVGPSVRIGGTDASGPAAVPVTYNDLYGPTKQYQEYVAGGVKTLLAKTRTLTSAVDRGDPKAAKRAWLPAHLAYEKLGAAYDTFGDFGDAIDGLPVGLPKGVHDPGFAGFHRVEYGLWHGESMSSLRKPADQLLKDVKGLKADLPNEDMEPGDLPLRAHEIMENTLQFELTEKADQGSGTSLATASANLEGTREAVDLLRPLLQSRYTGLKQMDAQLDRVQRLLDAQKHGDSWTPVASLDPSARESIDGAVGELLERLAPIATICYPRRTS